MRRVERQRKGRNRIIESGEERCDVEWDKIRLSDDDERKIRGRQMKTKGREKRKGVKLSLSPPRICQRHNPGKDIEHDILTPIRSKVSINNNMYSTPQTYPSGVISSGNGAYDWSLTVVTGGNTLARFHNLLQVRCAGYPKLCRLSPLTAKTTYSSISRMSVSDDINKRKKCKHEESCQSLFSFPSSSPPSLEELNNFSLESSPPSIRYLKSPKMRRENSLFNDILNESYSSLSSDTISSSPSEKEQIAHEVAQHFYQSFTKMYPHLFPDNSVDLFHHIVTSYLAIPSQSVGIMTSPS